MQPLAEAIEKVHELEALGVMRIATLEDGSLWCLTSSDHIHNIEVRVCLCVCACACITPPPFFITQAHLQHD
jgi:hypothetical protein